MTVVSGGDRTDDEARELIAQAARSDRERRIAWSLDESDSSPFPESGAALVEKVAELLSEVESLRARVEAARRAALEEAANQMLIDQPVWPVMWLRARAAEEGEKQ